MKPIVVVGVGGSGREILEIFKDQNKVSATWDILGFIDDNSELHGKLINGYPVLGGVDWLRKHSGCGCICAIAGCETKKKVVQKLDEIGVNFVNAIHPTVIMWDSVELGYDVILQAGAILSVDTKIGNHVKLNTNATIGHDSSVGDYCTIGPRVDISGNGRVGEGVQIGVHGVLLPNVSVGDWSIIGAGAVVVNNIPDRVVAVGVPAKVIKTRP